MILLYIFLPFWGISRIKQPLFCSILHPFSCLFCNFVAKMRLFCLSDVHFLAMIPFQIHFHFIGPFWMSDFFLTFSCKLWWSLRVCFAVRKTLDAKKSWKCIVILYLVNRILSRRFNYLSWSVHSDFSSSLRPYFLSLVSWYSTPLFLS